MRLAHSIQKKLCPQGTSAATTSLSEHMIQCRRDDNPLESITPFNSELSALGAFALNPLLGSPLVDTLVDTGNRSLGKVMKGVKALAKGSLWILLTLGCSDGGECEAELVPPDELDISLDVGDILGVPVPFIPIVLWVLAVAVVDVVPNNETNVLRSLFKLSDHRPLALVSSLYVGDPIPSSLSYTFGKPLKLPMPFKCPMSVILDALLIGGKLNTVDSDPCDKRLFPFIALLYAVKLEEPLEDLLYMEFKKSLVPFNS